MLFLEAGMFSWIIRIIEEYASQILIGIGRTLLLALLGTIVGFLLAIVFSLIRVSKINNNKKYSISNICKRILKRFVIIYVTVIRGTPMIVQAMIFYYLFHRIGIYWSPIQAGLFTVSINTTAYLTEVLRGGIESIDRGQIEGARSIGLSNFQAFIHVVFPQAIKNSMASIGNEFIVNIKDTAVLSVIGVLELYNSTMMAGNKYCKIVEGMLIAAAIYLILTYTTSKILQLIEKKIGVPVKEIVSCN